MAQVDREQVLIEVGTGTGCPYCPGAAMGLEDLYENGDPVAGIEYHSYNSGDPFNTPEAAARTSYYNISGYPTAYFDGGYNNYVGGSSSSSLYSSYLPIVNARMQVPAEFTVAITGDNSGDNYDVTVTVSKVAAYSGDNLVVHLALTESDIAYSWQGQSTIEFTERLMPAGSGGTAVTFPTNNSIVEVAMPFTFDNSWVKDNCELVAWIQDNSNKYVLNSASVMLPDLDPGYPTWQANFYADDSTFCESGTAHFHDESIGDPIQYSWTFEGGYPETSDLTNPNVYYAEPGAYDVQLIIYDGTRYDTAFKTAYINVGTPPEVSFSTIEDLCNEDWDPYVLSGGTPEGGYYSGEYVTDGMYFHPTAALVGDHDVYYTVEEAGCEATAEQSITVVNCVGLLEVSKDILLEVYPNPTTGIVNIDINTEDMENAELKVIDIVGKVIYSVDNVSNTMNIDLSDNPSGIYFIQIKNDKQNVSKKIFLK